MVELLTSLLDLRHATDVEQAARHALACALEHYDAALGFIELRVSNGQSHIVAIGVEPDDVESIRRRTSTTILEKTVDTAAPINVKRGAE
ncbi:MAG TPA: hypothetical protein VFQ53_32235 [Kofleriaceae bacterium]|nr:hypothetical protein [Kofleriaceae bacterium]